MKNTNILMIVAIVAVAFALFNLVITINKVGDIKTITGYAELQDTGVADVNIESNLVIVFTIDTLDWGAGHVDTPIYKYAVLDTTGTMLQGVNWLTVSDGLLLENQGNVDADLYFESTVDAHDFICEGQIASECTLAGGTADAEFQWQFSENITGSCPTKVHEVNDWSSWVDVCADGDATCDESPASAGEGRSICSDFQNIGTGTNEIRLDLRLVIPSDADTGDKQATITASAYAV
ncbi:MAG: hypothetical protein KKF48_02465 [Nanoarchaeota archaeon]|nr:hypothetical protein [Nanoarchaeota archaeon]MBU1027884.1 hypothetical protein [Nanoarchaeota archaeon]